MYAQIGVVVLAVIAIGILINAYIRDKKQLEELERKLAERTLTKK